MNRHRPPIDVRHHQRSDRLVVRRQLTLGNPVVREQDLVPVRDLDGPSSDPDALLW